MSRTQINDFQEAAEAIALLLAMEAFNFEDFVSLGCRGLMLLQHAILKYPEEFQKWRDEAKKGCPTED
jgi:hypothetical protein